MEHTYDIFKRRADGYPFWVTAVENLKHARKRTKGIALIVPGEYFIYSQGEGIILECVTVEETGQRVTRPIWSVPQFWNSLPHGRAA